jgi:uncharacterized protein YjbI with pentapeptide repeats
MPADYSGQNLRGRSFKGQDLQGADFSRADIRGADFTGANLRGVNFSHVEAGLQKRWAVFLVIVSWMLMGLSGFLLAFAGYLVARLLFQRENFFNVEYHIPGFIVTVVLILFCFVTIREGVQGGLRAVAFPVAVAGAVAVTVTGAAVGTIAFAVAFVGAIAGAVAAAIAFGTVGYRYTAFTERAAGTGLEPILPIAVVVVLLSTFISWRTLKGDAKHAVIRNIVVAFAAFKGTSFRNADLTDADFTSSLLKSTDFIKANVTRTCFYKTKKLDCVRPGSNYLQIAEVRQVLITGQGIAKNLNRFDLRGINFKGANLTDTNFASVDLSGANLQDANLSGAKLVQAQLDGTDFTGAILTGAYIQDWGITIGTKFDGVRCEYVYMHLPTKENPNPLRKPDNNKEVFGDGEFGDFIRPIVDTLDLYHSQGVDPRAIATAFKQLAEDNPNAELEIVAIERRGEDKILLRAKTAAIANKSELSKEYFINYNQLKALAERDFRELIANQTTQINRLENMITTALERPSFYAQTYNNQGDTTMTGDRNIHLGSGNYNERIQGDYVQGNYYATGQPQSLAQAAAEIQELLKQLEQTYPTTTTSQQMVVAAEAINRIENSPTMKQKVINAVKEGGLAAFEKAIDNPAGAFITGAIKGWQEIEAKD